MKSFGSKAKKVAAQAKKDTDEKKKILKNKDLSDTDKKELKLIDLRLKGYEQTLMSESAAAEARLNRMLKSAVPDEKKDMAEWKKDLAPWYRDMIEKESGIDFKVHGVKGKVWGDLSLEKKQATILLKFKLP